MNRSVEKTRKILVTIVERDLVVIDNLAIQRRTTPAMICRELIGKAIDAGLAV